jgi:invasion protein IalB
MLTVDQGTPYLVPYTWCLTNTCIAGTAADPKMIQEMGSGQTLRLEFVDANLLALTCVASACTVRLRQQGRAGTDVRAGH